MDGNGVRGEESALAAFFEVAQTGIDDFFHASEFGSPEVAHVVEAAVNRVEAGVHVRRKHGCHKTDHGGVE